MQQMFHKYSLKFGIPRRYMQQSTAITPVSPFLLGQSTGRETGAAFTGFFTEAGEGLELTQHQISFRINKSKETQADSEITIYNISDNTRKFLESQAGNLPQVELYLGYETTDMFLAFQGDVVKAIDEFDGVTRRTKLLLKTGTVEIKEAVSSRSYRGGVATSRVYEDLVFDLGLPLGNYQPSSIAMAPLKKPIVVQGNTFQILKKVTKEMGHNLYIEDNVVNLVSREWKNPSAIVATKISADTNMIGSPAAESEGEDLTSTQNGNRMALTVKTTMSHYKLDDVVEIDSKYHKGVYQISSIEYVGDFEGTDWLVNLKVKPVDGYEIRGAK